MTSIITKSVLTTELNHYGHPLNRMAWEVETFRPGHPIIYWFSTSSTTDDRPVVIRWYYGSELIFEDTGQTQQNQFFSVLKSNVTASLGKGVYRLEMYIMDNDQLVQMRNIQFEVKESLSSHDEALRQIAKPEKMIVPQTPFTWAEYQAFMVYYQAKAKEHHQIITRGDMKLIKPLTQEIFLEKLQLYRAKLPVYQVASCPICHQPVYEAIDTFSLVGPGWWVNEPHGQGWFGADIPSKTAYNYEDFYGFFGTRKRWASYQTQCPHLKAMRYGVNLNGLFPSEVTIPYHVTISSAQPTLLKPFMAQPGSYAVLHTLPVGWLDDEVWQPRYTAYFISYFYAESATPSFFESADCPVGLYWPYAKRAKHVLNEIGLPPRSPLYWPYEREDYHLKPYVESGQLQWLEPNSATLQRGPWADFPYKEMTGLPGTWYILNRKLHLMPKRDWLSDGHPHDPWTTDIKPLEQSLLAQFPLQRIEWDKPIKLSNPEEPAKISMDWVTVPAGEFTMGSDGLFGKPIHQVYLAEYQIARIPVTNEQWAIFLQESGYRWVNLLTWIDWMYKDKEKDVAQVPANRARFAIPPGKEKHPVVYVTWYDAMSFCRWLSTCKGYEQVRFPPRPNGRKRHGERMRVNTHGETPPHPRIMQSCWQ